MGYQKRIQSRSRQEILAGRGTGKMGRQKYLLVDGQEVIEEIWLTPEEYEEAQAKAEKVKSALILECDQLLSHVGYKMNKLTERVETIFPVV